MEKYPQSFEKIIDFFKTFTGIGRRSAERMAFEIIKWDEEKLREAGQLIAELKQKISHCEICGNLCETGNLCSICSDNHRDHSIICIVEDIQQIHSIEKSKVFRGLYHVLHGKIIPLDNKNLSSESLKNLKKRLQNGEIKEILMALSMDVEGQATSIYLSNELKNFPVKITRIARGIPAGSDISYADPATISAAIAGRTQMQ